MAAVDNPGECSVCLTTYDETDRQPRSLPCGHTFCSPCIVSCIKERQLSCPTCHACHPATSCNQFHVNFALLALLQMIRGQKKQNSPAAEEVEPVAAAATTEDNISSLSPELQLMLKKHKNKTHSFITCCQALQCQLDEYLSQLTEWNTRHLNFKELFKRLAEQNETVLKVVEQERANVLEMKEEGKEDETKLVVLLENLKDVGTIQESMTASSEAEDCFVKAQEWINKCQGLFPNENTTTAIRKVHEAATAALNTVAADADVAVEGVTITGKAKQITGAPQPVQIDAKDVYKSLESGKMIYGVKQHKGRSLYGKIELRRVDIFDKRLTLHCLQDQPLPKNAEVVQVDELHRHFSWWTMAFLDFSWNNMRKSVRISVNDRIPLGQQFVLLCSGLQGPSYLNTRMLGVKKCDAKDMKYETLFGGDYEHNNGKGGAPVLSSLQGNYEKAGDVGSIGCWCDEKHNTDAQFHIVIQAPKSYKSDAESERNRIVHSIKTLQGKAKSDAAWRRLIDVEHSVKILFNELNEGASMNELTDIERNITTLLNENTLAETEMLVGIRRRIKTLFNKLKDDAARRDIFSGFHVFGHVTEGMNVIQEVACEQRKGYKVEIVDCGVDIYRDTFCDIIRFLSGGADAGFVYLCLVCLVITGASLFCGCGSKK